ncbi:classical arabinogalactan protein 4 [Stenotrophomonas maltophilia]|uniref:classical arabinogalactan protein 4 n=1 Tax=Stenotrophomonas maltophilia TaxID=40324 RepID=UPI0007F8E0A4|nr:classical arabinogalactan protein 4 [Stenotrophomonas maltophilia]MBH1499283.1 classical arabinogalactan protein 4 [Stenotrophomonas maltophilia]MBH1535705.1 classical arabinogalactan protein 4 [Stenotrophomonas maltophilia]MBN4956045.1 classical arabinogalactan protein 4 [Stenotrophomonas maltophilia]MCU1110984.1 classical arabinogalactan protein 4 [Stenotrophomonas maltophilia]MDH1687763.1 classical arabinogalactan protein 4 [Stenotrophomonas maltophilia]
MKPIPPLLLMALLPLVAQAQVPTSSSPTSTRSATTVAPQPVVPPPQAARPQPQVLPSPQPTQPIKSTGPAQVAPAPVPKPADKVYDRNGRIVPGVRPAGPNRVFDSRTGRYYDSVPAGDGQQIKR